MMHKTRRWSVMPIEDFQKRRPTLAGMSPVEALAHVLTQHSWCSCNGFSLGAHAYLNDQTSPDGAAEFGVVRLDTLKQVETITFSWCNLAEARTFIADIQAGRYDGNAWSSGLTREQIQTPAAHATCGHCA